MIVSPYEPGPDGQAGTGPAATSSSGMDAALASPAPRLASLVTARQPGSAPTLQAGWS